MSISIDKVYNHSQNKISQNHKNQPAPSKKTQGRQFDEIVISSYKETDKENAINKALADKINAEVNQITDEDKIENLKNAIANNSYEINADEIAKRILGL